MKNWKYVKAYAAYIIQVFIVMAQLYCVFIPRCKISISTSSDKLGCQYWLSI